MNLCVEPIEISCEEAFASLAEESYTIFLDSSDAAQDNNRYSVLATAPISITKDWNDLQTLSPHPLPSGGPLPFCGGYIGYISYEAYRHLIPEVRPRKTDYPEVFFGFYDTFIVTDHGERKSWIASLGLDRPDGDSDEGLAREKIGDLKALVQSKIRHDGSCRFAIPLSCDLPSQTVSKGWTRATRRVLNLLEPTISKEQYRRDIAKIQEYIRAGDCYQVNYTQCFRGGSKRTAPELYQGLRKISPAPHAAYLNLGDFQILSSSPELFLKVREGHIETMPIKGTRRRGTNGAEDKRLRQELTSSPKDHAELLMITDLERNDLGRVCVPGSVRTTRLAETMKLAQVHHLYSHICGKTERPPFEIIAATFPGGSITGAPKIRAMQIIRELENHPREVYTGSIGFMGIDGRMEFNIAIRTMIYEKGEVIIYAGGGITSDSDPEAEYEECIVKASGMCEALCI